MQFIKATSGHIDAIAAIYGRIIDAQEQGRLTVGWQRGVYPTRQTALDALGRGDLFVCVDGGQVAAAAIINRIQVPVYAEVGWLYPAEPDEVMVLHTLVVDPLCSDRTNCHSDTANLWSWLHHYSYNTSCHQPTASPYG